MNIFVVDQNPTICAQSLDDLRLNKMIIETAQLLSTAMREYGYAGTDVYKSTHKNHPCAVWARQTQSNYLWLLTYFIALDWERRQRTGKNHKTYVNLHSHLLQGLALIPMGDLTPFANCSTYKHLPVFDAYKLTLKDKWAKDKRPPKWTNTNKPSWA